MSQTYEEAVIKTVLWWMDKSFHTLMNQDNGDDSPQAAMISVLMNKASSDAQNLVTPSSEKKFEERLTELLMKAEGRDRDLSVDYHPCELLSEAALYADIHPACFPCKSASYIDENNKVFAKWRYGKPYVEL